MLRLNQENPNCLNEMISYKKCDRTFLFIDAVIWNSQQHLSFYLDFFFFLN